MFHLRTTYYKVLTANSVVRYGQGIGVKLIKHCSTHTGHIEMKGSATKLGHLDRTATEPREKVSHLATTYEKSQKPPRKM